MDMVVPPRSLEVPLLSSARASPAAVYFATNAGICTFWKVVLGDEAVLPPKELEGPGSPKLFPS